MMPKVAAGSSQVRLNDEERAKILQAVELASKSLAIEWQEIALFGSRIDLGKRGGDIDLYLQVQDPHDAAHSFKRKLRIQLNELLGEQKIDIVIDKGQGGLGAMGEVIRGQKVVLWTRK